MALFDRNDNRSFGNRGDVNRGRGGGFMNAVRRGWDQVEDRFQAGGRDYDAGYGGGMNRGGGYAGGGSNWERPMDREGGLHQRNSWSDGAWTADAAERTDREWNHDNRGGMDRGGMSGGGMSGGMGMNRGIRNDSGWNLGTGDREWGHTGNLGGAGYDRGYSAGGMNRGGGGFLDRAQNAVRRGWDQVEDRFDRDDADRMHMGGSSMRGGTSWAGNYDRDMHYGAGHSPGMMGGNAGMNRYGGDYDRGRMGGGDWDRGDRGYKGRDQVDNGDPFGDRQNRTPIRMVNNEGRMGNRGGTGNGFRYDEGFRGGRDWF